MHASIDSKRADIAALCKRLGVVRLDVFGSATTDAFDEVHSDADFVVEFTDAPGFDRFDAYFSLREGLEALLNRPVDLVVRRAMKNPYFRARVAETQESVYAT